MILNDSKLITNIAILVLCIAANSVQADKSVSTSGDYAKALTKIRVQINTPRVIMDVCEQSYPEFSTKNMEAFIAWRTKYYDFHQEMLKHMSKNIIEEELIYRDKIYIDYFKESVRNSLRSNKHHEFKEICQHYPEYLKSERTDIEHYYAEQVQIIRHEPDSGK